jgi:hypothetical protein
VHEGNVELQKSAAAMATYKVNVTALHDESGHVVCSYLLEVDSVRIMLDCGWDESFNTGRLKQLER